jgi:hypothetical protein
LGPKYRYHTKIKNPKQLGMSPDGNMGALARDVRGLISYVELLVDGGGNANMAGKPLGDKFFLKTASKCKDVKTGNEVTRYHYVDNQIDGSIPGLTELTGFKSGLKGLVIGALADTFSINPMGLLAGFVEGSKPWCKAVRKKVIDDSSNESYETHHIALTDLEDSELSSSDRKKLKEFKKNMKNNDTNASCREKFSNMKDPVPNLYFLTSSLLFFYLLYKLAQK